MQRYRKFIGGGVAAAAIALIGVCAPSALAAAANPNAAISSISCTAPGDCSAIANYDDSIGVGETLLLTETNGHWARAQSPKLPTDSFSEPFAPSDPTQRQQPGPLQALFQALSSAPGLSRVECSAPGYCTALGSFTDKYGYEQGLSYSEVDGSWSSAPVVVGPQRGSRRGPFDLVPDQLSCPSADACVAAGDGWLANGTAVPVFAQERAPATAGGSPRWRYEAATPGAGLSKHGEFAVPTSLACRTAGQCVAVGMYLTPHGQLLPLRFTQSPSGSSWSAQLAKLPANAEIAPRPNGFAGGALLTAVSCPADGACTAVGEYQNHRLEELPFTLSENASNGGLTRTWGPSIELPLPAAAPDVAGYEQTQLNAIDCSTGGSCTAVGSFLDSNHNRQGLLLREASGSWQAESAMLPSPYKRTLNGQFVRMTGISCAGAGDCLATGSYNYAGTLRPRTSFVVAQSDGSWAPGSNPILPAGHAHLQANAAITDSCVAAGSCTVGGYYTNLPGQTVAYLATETDGNFNDAATIKLPTKITHTELLNSLLSVLLPAGPGSVLQNVKRSGGYTYRFTAAERGKVSGAWYTKLHGHRILIGSFSGSAPAVGTWKQRLKLNQAGRKLFSKVKKVTVTATAAFVSAHGRRVSNHHSFQLANSTIIFDSQQAGRLRLHENRMAARYLKGRSL